MRLIYHVLLTSFLSFSAGAKPSTRHSNSNEASQCLSTTVNYITQTLPQQCLRTNWTRPGSNGTQDAGITTSTGSVSMERGVQTPAQDTAEPASSGHITTHDEPTSTPTQEVAESSSPPVAEAADEDGDPLADQANFLSFEEWKSQMLERAGQSPDHIVGSAPGANEQGHTRQRQPGINNALDSLGDDGEIELDFTGFVNSEALPDSPTKLPSNVPNKVEAADGDTPSSPVRRSRDAGTTSKERFNYASFDCAATVLKTNQGSKGATWILSENKDSYLINKCAEQNKYFIVEMCNDILIDTVVLGNFEFFSSTFRTFRVSISDRYPVKAEKWREIGTFEARNTRGVQAFMVEDGLFWARYLKIEMLTHYGSEYYCPVSLLRVHGTTMVDDWRNEMKENNEQDDDEGEEALLITSGEVEPPEVIPIPPIKTNDMAVLDVIGEETSATFANAAASTSSCQSQESFGQSSETVLSTASAAVDQSTETTSFSDAQPVFNESSGSNVSPEKDSLLITPVQAAHPIKSEPPLTEHAKDSAQLPSAAQSSETLTSSMNATEPLVVTPTAVPNVTSSTVTLSLDLEPSTTSAAPATNSPIDVATTLSGPNIAQDSSTTIAATPVASEQKSTVADVQSADITNGATRTKTKKSSPIKAALATPSTQDSFFRSVHKRLTMLEMNATLSLQYIEEQSRILRDAFQKAEKKQLQKTSSFLETLNKTVFAELRTLQVQYDQHWQSTVLELASQREDHQKDMLIIYEKLGMLANGLIWQQRMAYAQLVLLVFFFGIAIFTKGVVPFGNDVPLDLTFLESIQHLRRGNSMSFSRRYPSSPDSIPGTPNRPRSFGGMFSRSPNHKRDHSGYVTSGDELITNPTSSPEQRRDDSLRVCTSNYATAIAKQPKSPSVSFGPMTPASDHEDALDRNSDALMKKTDTGTDTERETDILDVDPAALKRAASSPPLGRQFEPPADDDLDSNSDETARAISGNLNIAAPKPFEALSDEPGRAMNEHLIGRH